MCYLGCHSSFCMVLDNTVEPCTYEPRTCRKVYLDQLQLPRCTQKIYWKRPTHSSISHSSVFGGQSLVVGSNQI